MGLGTSNVLWYANQSINQQVLDATEAIPKKQDGHRKGDFKHN